MACGKKAYQTRKEAKQAMRKTNVVFKSQGKPTLKHIYWCKHCFAYHHTSMEHEKSREAGEKLMKIAGRFKITPQVKKDLQLIATNLPTVLNNTIEYHNVTGKELKEMDIEKDLDGAPIQDGKIYKWKYPVQLATNHYRALAKAYTGGGEPAVIAYIRKIKNMPKA